jgi:hypothetical protein
LRGQSFPILKKKRVLGIDTLTLRTSPGVGVDIPREWTDHADPSLSSPPRILDGECLVALADLLESIEERPEKELDR